MRKTRDDDALESIVAALFVVYKLRLFVKHFQCFFFPPDRR